MHAERKAISHSARYRRAFPIAKAAAFLISINILYSMICFQETLAQEAVDREISELAQRLDTIEKELASAEEELTKLEGKYNAVTSEKNRLTRELLEDEAKPKGFLSRIRGIFSRKRGRISNLMTESRDLADSISNLTSKTRNPLVRDLVVLTDELIDKSTSRMTELMEVVNEANLNNDLVDRNAAWERVSGLWQLAEETAEVKRKYAPDSPVPEQTRDLPSLLSEDPDDLRLGAAILKDWAVAERDESAHLDMEIEKLQRRVLLMKRMTEVSEKIQRSDEERGATGVGTIQIPWGSVDKSGVDDIEEKISELMILKKQHEADAERFEGQSRTLEQRASQMDLEIEGRSEDD